MVSITRKRRTRKNRRPRRGGKGPDQYLSYADELAIRNHAARLAAGGAQRHATNHMALLILLDSGLRPTELTYVTIADTPAGHGKDAIEVRDGKGHVDRVVEIPTVLARQIRRFVKDHRPGAKPASPLLASEAGVRRRVDREGIIERSSRLSYRSLYERMKVLAAGAGIELYPYQLRHTYATKLAATDPNLIMTRDQLGHSSVRTTEIYAKTRNAERRRAIARLNEPLFALQPSDNTEQPVGYPGGGDGKL